MLQIIANLPSSEYKSICAAAPPIYSEKKKLCLQMPSKKLKKKPAEGSNR